MKKSEGSAPKIEAATAEANLELPDWSEMDDSSARVDAATAFRLCEEYANWIRKYGKEWNLERSEKCLVEFVL